MRGRRRYSAVDSIDWQHSKTKSLLEQQEEMLPTLEQIGTA
jgi:hypothetical protein